MFESFSRELLLRRACARTAVTAQAAPQEEFTMQNFKTYQLAVEFYQRASKLSAPQHLRDQLARASSSIALNTAEGAGRWDTQADRKRFFRMALGSLRESVAILDLLGNKEPRIRQLADSLGAMLYTLSRP